MQPQVEAGTIRALAIAGPSRNAALPHLPTTAEAGFPSVLAATWFALFATGGTPPERIASLHAALNAAMADPVLRARITEGGVDIETSASPAEFTRFYLEERARWGAVVRRANIQAE
jgi:tripartite-type tricarboxylate transporter receptor subunit TctC